MFVPFCRLEELLNIWRVGVTAREVMLPIVFDYTYSTLTTVWRVDFRVSEIFTSVIIPITAFIRPSAGISNCTSLSLATLLETVFSQVLNESGFVTSGITK